MIPSAQPAEVALREFDQFHAVDERKLRRDAMCSLEDKARADPMVLFGYLENDVNDIVRLAMLVAGSYNQNAAIQQLEYHYNRALRQYQDANVDDEIARLREEQEE